MWSCRWHHCHYTYLVFLFNDASVLLARKLCIYYKWIILWTGSDLGASVKIFPLVAWRHWNPNLIACVSQIFASSFFFQRFWWIIHSGNISYYVTLCVLRVLISRATGSEAFYAINLFRGYKPKHAIIQRCGMDPYLTLSTLREFRSFRRENMKRNCRKHHL